MSTVVKPENKSLFQEEMEKVLVEDHLYKAIVHAVLSSTEEEIQRLVHEGHILEEAQDIVYEVLSLLTVSGDHILDALED